jgi:hypothetical protein
MARYTVIWDKVLQENYTDMWTRSDPHTREILTQIANWVDHNLAVDPEIKGQERPEVDGRVLAVPSSDARVAVIYRVMPADRQVFVKQFIFRRLG